MFAEVAVYNPGACGHLRPERLTAEKLWEGEGGGRQEEEEGGSEVEGWPEIFPVGSHGMQSVPCHGALQKKRKCCKRTLNYDSFFSFFFLLN